MNKILIFTFCLTALLSLMCSGCQVNPVTGEQQLSLFMPSLEEQKQIGAQYAPEMEKQLGGPIADPQLQSYINTVGQQVARVSHTPNEQFRYTALNDETINAFALPGGYIYITKGMLRQLKTESQLAAILAHETAHVTAQHSAQAMSQQIGMEFLLSAIGTQTPQGVSTVAQLTSQLIGLKYSRTHETQADSIGLDYMVKAGYNPNGMTQTMQILQQQGGSGSFDFLSTHPSPENRLGTIQQQISSRYASTAGLVGDQQYQQNVLSKLGPKTTSQAATPGALGFKPKTLSSVSAPKTALPAVSTQAKPSAQKVKTSAPQPQTKKKRKSRR